MKKKDTKRIIIEIIFVVIAAFVLYTFLKHSCPDIMDVLGSGNIDTMEAYLEAHRRDSKFLLVILQIIETVSIVLPSAPVYVCSGVIFGKLQGFAVCYGMNLVLNALIFEVARKVEGLKKGTVDIKKQEFITGLIEKAKHIDRVVVAMCLLPIVPNGMIPYLSAQTDITLPKFLRALAIGSCPSILTYTICGGILVSDKYEIIGAIVVVLILVGVFGLLFKKQWTTTIEPKLKSFIEG